MCMRLYLSLLLCGCLLRTTRSFFYSYLIFIVAAGVGLESSQARRLRGRNHHRLESFNHTNHLNHTTVTISYLFFSTLVAAGVGLESSQARCLPGRDDHRLESLDQGSTPSESEAL